MGHAREDIAGIQPELYGFTGKLVNYGPASSKTAQDYTSLLNFRHFDGGIGTRQGTAGWTSNADPNGSSVVEIIPYFTDTEQHIIAATASTSGLTYYKIDSGSFTAGNKLYGTTGTTATPITAAKVRDTLVIGDAGGVTMYAGVSAFPNAFLVETLSGGSPVFTDRYDWIYDGKTHTVTSGNTVHIGYSRPFDRFQSNQSSSMDSMQSSVTEYMKSGKMRFWLSYQPTGGGSTFYLPKIESLARELGTSWDGKSWIYPIVAGVHLTGVSEFKDHSKDVDNASEELTMDLSQMQSGGTIFLGFTYRPRLVHIFLPESYKNSVSSVMTAQYSIDGGGFANVLGFSDGTSSGGITLKQSGVLDFERITNWTMRKIGQSPYDLYVLALKINTTISNYVKVYQIKAIPDYDSPSSVGKFKGVATAHDRLYLYNGRDKTKLLISAENQPDCFIGSDANDEVDKPIMVGKQESFMFVGALGENVLIMKESENFIKGGVNRNTWTMKQLNGTAACVAPKSVAVIEKDGSIFAIYLARSGIYALDSSGANPCVSTDIRAYWQPGHSLELPAASVKAAVGWYDATYEEYHLLVNNYELVYSLRSKKWTTFDRTLGIQTGTFFVDPNKVRYHLLGGTGGTVYQAETGTSDYGQPIVSDLTRPPVALGKRYATSNELRALSIRYECQDGTAINGNTLYVTPSLGGATTYSTTFDLANADWKFFNMSELRNGLKGWNHQVRMVFRGRVNLDGQVMWTREAPWSKSTTVAASGTTSAPTPTPTPAYSPATGLVFVDESGGQVFQNDGGLVFHDF